MTVKKGKKVVEILGILCSPQLKGRREKIEDNRE
jgi:hypothetical protein